jgi:hypothetical protein
MLFEQLGHENGEAILPFVTQIQGPNPLYLQFVHMTLLYVIFAVALWGGGVIL